MRTTLYVVTHTHTYTHTFTSPLSALTPYQIPRLPPVSKVTKWGPSYRLATREQWAPRRRNGLSKGQAILWRWREVWRDGSRGGERRGWGVMGMVLGHIFNRVTKRVPAWETRLCFSNPAGRLCSTLLRSAHSHNLGGKKSKTIWLQPLFYPNLRSASAQCDRRPGVKPEKQKAGKNKILRNLLFRRDVCQTSKISLLCYAD